MPHPDSLSWTSVFPGLDRTVVGPISKRSGPVHVNQRLSCRSGLTAAPGGTNRSVGQICLRTGAEPGTVRLVFYPDPCSCIGRWAPGLIVEFAGARHHLAYWLGTSLRGQERSPEHIVVPYPATSQALRSDRHLIPVFPGYLLSWFCGACLGFVMSLWNSYLDISLMQQHMIAIYTRIALP